MAIIGVLVIGLIIGLLARFITPGPNPRGIIVTMVIGIVGAVIATYGGQALGLYQYGEPAGFGVDDLRQFFAGDLRFLKQFN